MSNQLANDDWLETYKSLIVLSVECLKFSALANGGASVALLAYLGNVAAKGGTTPDMRGAMAAFLVGLLACGVAWLFAYLTQFKRLREISSEREHRISHGWILWAAIAFFACSLVAFGFGSWEAVVRFK